MSDGVVGDERKCSPEAPISTQRRQKRAPIKTEHSALHCITRSGTFIIIIIIIIIIIGGSSRYMDIWTWIYGHGAMSNMSKAMYEPLAVGQAA